MSIETILALEAEGLSTTISDYTRDNYILSYTRKLIEYEYPKDKEVLLLIIEKLVSWYADNYENILESRYITNKSAHTKSYELLKELRVLIHKAG